MYMPSYNTSLLICLPIHLVVPLCIPLCSYTHPFRCPFINQRETISRISPFHINHYPVVSFTTALNTLWHFNIYTLRKWKFGPFGKPFNKHPSLNSKRFELSYLQDYSFIHWIWNIIYSVPSKKRICMGDRGKQICWSSFTYLLRIIVRYHCRI